MNKFANIFKVSCLFNETLTISYHKKTPKKFIFIKLRLFYNLDQAKHLKDMH